MEVKRDIEINIDELVLHGFSPADKHRISQALQEELTALFYQKGVPSSAEKDNIIASLRGGSFQMSSSDAASAIGSRIANTVYSSFQHE